MATKPSPAPGPSPTNAPAGEPVFDASSVVGNQSTTPTGSIMTWPVYWGKVQGAGETDASDRKSGAQVQPNVPHTVADAMLAWNDPGTLSDLDKKHLALALFRAGLVSNPGNYDQVQQAWNQAVQDAAQANVAGKMVTPLQMLSQKIAFAASVRQDKPGTTSTSNSTNYNIPSPQDSEAIVKSVFQQGIGRDPTQNELAKYSTMISGIAQKNPSTSSSTSTTDAQGNSHTSTTTHEKAPTQAGYQQALMDQVQQNPEYGAYQAATTYYNAALQAISSPVHL
jgi:hypothetical protein